MDWLIVAGLLLAPLLVFLKAALLRGVFYIHDIQYYFLPYQALPAASVWRGELPLWNRYAFGGIPLLGDGQTAMFYPPNWLYFVLPDGAALNYAILLQFSMAGCGMYLLGRSLNLWRIPALLGAVAYMFCGFMTARIVHPSILGGVALLPLVILCVDRALQTGGGWLAAGAGAIALQALTGHPQIPVYTAMALALYTLVRSTECWWTDRDWNRVWRVPVRLAVVYLLGLGLAAIQLVPWAELASQTPRAEGGVSLRFIFGGSMQDHHWLLMLFPYLFGSAASPGLYGAGSPSTETLLNLWEHSAYVGILPLALAVFALCNLGARPPNGASLPGRDSAAARTSRMFSILAVTAVLVVGLVLALGKHTPFAPLIYVTPVLGKLRCIERGMALVAVALTLLAAFGMQRIMETDPSKGGWRRASLLILAVLTAVLPLLVVHLTESRSFQRWMDLSPRLIGNLQLTRPNAAIPVVMALFSGALLLWWCRRPAGAVTQALAVGLVAIDLGVFAACFYPTTDPRLYERRPDVLNAFRSETAPFRKATLVEGYSGDVRETQETLAVSWGMVYGVEDINGFNSLQPRRHSDFLFGSNSWDVSYGFLNRGAVQQGSSLLNALNVRYVLVPTRTHFAMGTNFNAVYENAYVKVYENPGVCPRVYLAEEVRENTNRQEVLRLVQAPGFDGRRLTLVEAADAPVLAAAAGDEEPVILEYGANRVVISANVAVPRFLVLADMYFPGWRARVDGATTRIYRTNYLFRGIVVPPGRHTITFEYRPMSVAIGALISLLSIFIAVVLFRRTTAAHGAGIRAPLKRTT